MMEIDDTEYYFDNPYEDWRYEDDGIEYLDCDESYRKFSTGWDTDDPIYYICLELEGGDFIDARFFYHETTKLEIRNKKEILLQLDNSNFGREYFLIYDGEKISPKSREYFFTQVNSLLRLKIFL